MKKTLLLIIIFVIIGVVGVLIYQNLKQEEQISPKGEITMPEEAGKEVKKIAMIIAFRDFRDEEYFIPKSNFLREGFSVTTVSTSLDQAIGANGGETEVNLLIEELNVKDYEAVLFIGGPGAAKYLDDEKFHQIAKEAVSAGKILGAICIAPAILAKAGVLSGKKATVWSSIMDKSAVKILKDSGAIYQPDSVVVDGKIVTANGPGAAKEFANKTIELLKE